MDGDRDDVGGILSKLTEILSALTQRLGATGSTTGGATKQPVSGVIEKLVGGLADIVIKLTVIGVAIVAFTALTVIVAALVVAYSVELIELLALVVALGLTVAEFVLLLIATYPITAALIALGIVILAIVVTLKVLYDTLKNLNPFDLFNALIPKAPTEGGEVQKSVTDSLLQLGNTVTSISGKFESLADPFRKFVEALSPGEVTLFDLAMRNLNATIGLAVIPVFQILSEAVTRAAGILQPAMEKLAPVFADLTNAVVNLLLSGLRGFVFYLEILTPILKILSGVIEELTEIYSAFYEVFLVVVNIFKDLYPIMSGLVALLTPIGQLILQVYLLAATFRFITDQIKYLALGFAQLAGFVIALLAGKAAVDKTIANARSREAREKQGGVNAAATNIGFKGFEQIGKDLAIAASYAGGKSPEEDTKHFQEMVLTALDKGATFAVDLPKLIQELPSRIAEALKEKAINEGKDIAKRARDQAVGIVRGAVAVIAPGL